MNIFLIGYMGCGKTTIGKKLARKLGWQFVDMDAWIEARTGMSIPDIFEKKGEEVFRSLEHEAVVELSVRNRLVVATGGGAPCFNNNMDLMNDDAITIYIKMTPEALVYRLQHAKEVRPLVKGKSPDELLAYIKEHLASRKPFYEQAALVVTGENLEPEQLLHAIRRVVAL
ncbi:MAG: shikimate kinase [Flavobacteriales bacterium]|nr:shikimate kinase [Flavobacteriales bacterium]MCB9448156.1 shikimate kinase [Flavobacteriales bacterium]